MKSTILDHFLLSLVLCTRKSAVGVSRRDLEARMSTMDGLPLAYLGLLSYPLPVRARSIASKSFSFLRLPCSCAHSTSIPYHELPESNFTCLYILFGRYNDSKYLRPSSRKGHRLYGSIGPNQTHPERTNLTPPCPDQSHTSRKRWSNCDRSNAHYALSNERYCAPERPARQDR
jgi:hypothetical protein